MFQKKIQARVVFIFLKQLIHKLQAVIYVHFNVLGHAGIGLVNLIVLANDSDVIIAVIAEKNIILILLAPAIHQMLLVAGIKLNSFGN